MDPNGLNIVHIWTIYAGSNNVWTFLLWCSWYRHIVIAIRNNFRASPHIHLRKFNGHLYIWNLWNSLCEKPWNSFCEKLLKQLVWENFETAYVRNLNMYIIWSWHVSRQGICGLINTPVKTNNMPAKLHSFQQIYDDEKWV